MTEEALLASGITRFKYEGGWVSDKAGDGAFVIYKMAILSLKMTVLY